MDRLFTGLAELPAGDLAEIRYVDLTRDPVATVAGIYQRLNLGGFEQARPAIAAFARDNVRTELPAAKPDQAFSQAQTERLAPYRRRLGYAEG